MLKQAIYISAGLGNAIFLIPLMKELKKRGSLTAIVTSNFGSAEIFNKTDDDLFEKVISLNGPSDSFRLAPYIFKKFDVVYADYFSATKNYLSLNALIAKRIVTNRIPVDTPLFAKRKIDFIEPLSGLHEGAQYLRFVDRNADDKSLSEHSFLLRPLSKTQSKVDYISIQPGAGNNQTPWKTWPIEQWLELVKMILKHQSNITIKVLGDQFDRDFALRFTSLDKRVTTLIGNTPVSELPKILGNAKLHIGGDSGLTHIAGAVGTPTITLVGGSDPELFGWHKVNKKHTIVQRKLKCHPCYRWYLPNRSRVDLAADCPDFKCIKQITAAEVFKVVRDKIELHV